MITNWDIIAVGTDAQENRLFSLVIDGTDNDARLMAKKLIGYVQAPTPAQPPFTFALSLPSNLDDTTLDKIRTAVKEGVEQVNKVNQFVPGGVLGNPLFNGEGAATNNAAQVAVNPEDSFLAQAPAVQPTPRADATQTPSSAEITVSDKDMLIKDMEDTLLGKMPLEDIFSAETKYDMFLDVENQTLTKNAQAQRAQQMEQLSQDVAQADDAFNIFDQQIKDQTNVMDLEDLHTVTSKLTQKDLGFVEHANTARNLPTDLSSQSVQTGEEDLSNTALKAAASLPEEMTLEATVPPSSINRQVNPQDGLPDIAVRGNEDDSLERTFNLETTLSTEVMRTQYEKSFRTEPTPTVQTPAPPAAPAPAHPVIHLRKKEAPQAPQPPQVQPPHPGKTVLHLRPKPQPQPAAPAVPAAPPAVPASAPNIPAAAEHAQPAASAAPAVTPAPAAQPAAAAPKPAPTAQPKPAPAPAEASIEKTKTIDHSIELPLSELKKHNWPLEIPLLPTYTLDNLVLSVNRFAHATAISVIDNPGKMYNPLVFHGTTGTGKTHFLNAMAYGFSKKYGQENVFITNGVRLSRGIQRYVVEGNIEKFEKFMDSVKVLLIDDIHLLAINEQNRAHISKLLNKFLKEQKQIVITSKYPPESLNKLEDLIQFHLDSGWISELKTTTGNAHFKIVKSMLMNNGVDLTDAQISQFFGGPHMTLSTIVRSIRRLKVLENLVFPNLPEDQRSQANMFEKLLATNGEDSQSEILSKEPSTVTSIHTVGNGEWGRVGFFYPSNSADAMNWMVYALQQRAKELGIPGGFEIAVRSSYSTENIISSAFKIANLCDNKKLRGAIILGPALTACEPSVRENFYDILTHMLEIMLIRCGIINTEALRSPSTYVKVISELLR